MLNLPQYFNFKLIKSSSSATISIPCDILNLKLLSYFLKASAKQKQNKTKQKTNFLSVAKDTNCYTLYYPWQQVALDLFHNSGLFLIAYQVACHAMIVISKPVLSRKQNNMFSELSWLHILKVLTLLVTMAAVKHVFQITTSNCFGGETRSSRNHRKGKRICGVKADTSHPLTLCFRVHFPCWFTPPPLFFFYFSRVPKTHGPPSTTREPPTTVQRRQPGIELTA